MAFTSSWVFQAVDRFSGPTNAMGRILDRVNRRINSLNLRARAASVSINTLSEKMGKLALVGATALSFGLPIKHAIQFEEKMAEIRKVVDFERPDGLRMMGEDIKNMSRRIPVTAMGLADIAAAGGQFGIAERDIVSFTEMVAKVSVAFDMMAKDTGIAAAKISNIFDMQVTEFGNLADTINFISNNTASSAEEIVRALQNKGAAAGAAMELTSHQTAAVASSFIQMGVDAERTGSIMQGMARGMNKLASENKAFAAIMKEKGAIGGMRALAGVFDKMPDSVERATLATKIFGIDFGMRIQALLGEMTKGTDGVVSKTLELASSQERAGSVMKEFLNRTSTTAAQFQMLKNAMFDVSEGIGNKLLPAVNSVLFVLVGLLSAIDKFIDLTGPLVPALLAIAVALATIKFVGLAASLVLDGLALSMAVLTSPVGLVVAGIVALVAVISWASAEFGGLKNMFSAMWTKIKNFVSGLGLLESMIMGIVVALTAWKVATVALIVAKRGLVAVLGLLRIGAMVTGIVSFVSSIGPAITLVIGLVRGLGLLRVAMVALNIVMTANPVGLIVVAIGALIGLIVWAVKEFESFEDAVRNIGAMIFGLMFKPLEGVLWVLDKILGTDMSGTLNSISRGVQDIMINAGVDATGEGLAAMREANGANKSEATVDVNINAPSGAVKSVQSRGTGGMKLRTGQNMGLEPAFSGGGW